MIIGRMDKRISLQAPAGIKDNQGGSNHNFIDVLKVWAEFRTPSVKELAATGTIVSDLIQQISIRRRTDVRRGWRILYETRDISGDPTKNITRTFKIQHAYDPDMQTTMLVCQEVFV